MATTTADGACARCHAQLPRVDLLSTPHDGLVCDRCVRTLIAPRPVRHLLRVLHRVLLHPAFVIPAVIIATLMVLLVRCGHALNDGLHQLVR